LEIQDGKRDPRQYWQLGRAYFEDAVFQEQRFGDTCRLAESNFQLMRNFLFAATTAGDAREFGVVAMVPEKTGDKVKGQLLAFQQGVLSEPYRSRINVSTYDSLAGMLLQSIHQPTIVLGNFLRERMTKLL
jgi:hypothetical protein